MRQSQEPVESHKHNHNLALKATDKAIARAPPKTAPKTIPKGLPKTQSTQSRPLRNTRSRNVEKSTTTLEIDDVNTYPNSSPRYPKFPPKSSETHIFNSCRPQFILSKEEIELPYAFSLKFNRYLY